MPVTRLFPVLLLAAASAAASPCETLAPLLVRQLPLPTFRMPGGISWQDDRHVLIGAESGVNEYDLESGAAKRTVSGSPIPYGLPNVQNLSGDGQRLFAFNYDYSDLAFDVTSSRILKARRHAAFQIMDVAVRGETLAVLGRPIMLKADFGALWVGRIGAPWEEFRPFRPLDGTAMTIFKAAFAPHGGAVVIQKNGTIAIATPAEAGVHRFAPDGTEYPTLGAELTQLVVPRLVELRKYNVDERGRYEAIFNKQPAVDDLLETPDDLALVVRRPAGDRVTWDLWFPDAKTTRRVVHLDLCDAIDGARHLQCATRGPRIACVYGKTTGYDKAAIPHIALFDLRQARACPVAKAAVEGWTWSEDCAPHREGESCPQTMRYSTKVKAGTEVRWGTEPMLAAIADALLPVAVADANGLATFDAPKGERVFGRAAGPSLASAWTAMPAALIARQGTAVAMRVDPPQGARVELRSLDAAGLPFRGAGDGAVELPPVPLGSMRAVVWSDDGAPAVISALPGELPRTVTLAKGVTLRGVTVNEESAAVEKAAITASFVIPRERITIEKRATSDARGAFAISGLAMGDVAWSAKKEPFAQRAEVIRAQEDVDLGPVILPRAREVSVVVTDEQARPIANATVRADAARSVRTNDRGAATLRGVAASQYRLRVSAKGYLPFDESSEGNANVRLAKAARVHARIVSEKDGLPAGPGTAAVQINGRKSIEEFDASGVLELDDLDAGRLDIEVRPDGFAPFRVPERRIAKGEDVDLGAIRVSRGFGIVGRAVDASGAPVSNVLLRVLRPGAFIPALAYLRGEWAAAQSAADGAFRIAGLAPGVYTLWSESAGRAPVVKTGITVGESDAEIGDVSLQEAHALRIRCEPAAQCGNEASVGIGGVDWLPLAAPLADGSATIAPLPAGEAVLRLTDRGGVVHERDVTISSTERTTEVRIAMRGVTVTGRVTRGGRAVGEGLVRLSTTEQKPFVQLAQVSPAGTIGNEIIGVVPRVVSASVGGDGGFQLRDVAPGRYAATWLSDTTESAPRTIVIPEAEAFALALELPESGVSGIVRRRDGSAPRQAAVTVEQGARRVNILADRGGNFSFIGLDAGPATLRASGEGLAAEERVNIEEGKSAFAQLTLEQKRVNDVAVLVTGDAGPQANVFVFLRQSGQLQASATGADGRAIFHLPPSASTAEVSAWSPAYGWMFAAPRALGDELAEVAIAMHRTAAGLMVEGKGAVGVWSPSGFPLHEALQLLGVRSAAPLRIDGLPAGRYGVTSANARKDVEVTDRVAEVRF